MVSHPDVLRPLARFVCVRLDWTQMQKQKERLRVPTQGNQVLLDPSGNYIPGIAPRGRRYPVEELVALLDRVLAEFPPDPRRGDDLELSWFLFNAERHGLPPYAGCELVARVDRKPILTVSGPVPAWLESPAFLRQHLRQFVWTRGPESGATRFTVRQVDPEKRILADLEVADAASASEGGGAPPAVSVELDAAWLEYMKVRPMVARGYIDNPHGNWLRAVLEKVHSEEVEVRAEARAGTLRPPGRAPEAAPASH